MFGKKSGWYHVSTKVGKNNLTSIFTKEELKDLKKSCKRFGISPTEITVFDINKEKKLRKW